ncbi:hypothetical protein [Methylobacterium oryzae]|uniref:hypothetical protein n=1 Tax=Methylobacterium oryzae TaxID=334852 RepID=UPI002F2CDD44
MRTALDFTLFTLFVVVGLPVMLACLVVGGILTIAEVVATLFVELVVGLPASAIIGVGAYIAKRWTMFMRAMKARAA